MIIIQIATTLLTFEGFTELTGALVHIDCESIAHMVATFKRALN
jgi:hypothetical protein